MSKPSSLHTHLKLKRAYVPAAASDGLRILVERLWPRGVSKQEAALDDWLKALAPSTELRKWFDHDPARWAEFIRRYRAELHTHAAELERLRSLARAQTVTLVYGSRDEVHNAAVALREVLLDPDAPD
ncbi:MAG: DUF488 family protein [Thermomonas sp.]|uniref:DUF488 domain-containing protein n=1 Tax=Thermomonas sp. TaxID=1971895 RepID=UPI00262B3248|nr:DUF488 family protein [Thermomonas sp.]MCC7096545.1 DUF488 family protein [Thermomonas sp.]